MNIQNKKFENFTMGEMFNIVYGITTFTKLYISESLGFESTTPGIVFQKTTKELELTDMEKVGLVSLIVLHQELLEEIEFRKSNNPEYKN
jgi:hypothetical protein